MFVPVGTWFPYLLVMSPFRALLLLAVVSGARSWAPPPRVVRSRVLTKFITEGIAIAVALPLFASPHNALAVEDCLESCRVECRALVPGNEGYCEDNCKTTCADSAAQQPLTIIEEDGAKEVVNTAPEVGLFGRASGNSVERLAASVFGANKQGQDVKVADKDAYVNDIVRSFQDAVAGK